MAGHGLVVDERAQRRNSSADSGRSGIWKMPGRDPSSGGARVAGRRVRPSGTAGYGWAMTGAFGRRLEERIGRASRRPRIIASMSAMMRAPAFVGHPGSGGPPRAVSIALLHAALVVRPSVRRSASISPSMRATSRRPMAWICCRGESPVVVNCSQAVRVDVGAVLEPPRGPHRRWRAAAALRARRSPAARPDRPRCSTTVAAASATRCALRGRVAPGRRSSARTNVATSGFCPLASATNCCICAIVERRMKRGGTDALAGQARRLCGGFGHARRRPARSRAT